MQIGVRELKTRLSEVLRDLESRGTIDITSRGRTVARLVPGSAPETKDEELAESPLDWPDRGPLRIADAQPVWDLPDVPDWERIGIRELKAGAAQVLKDVQENKRVYLITRQGKVVARLTPAFKLLTAEEWIAEGHRAIERIDKLLPPDLVVDAVEILNEERGRHERMYEEGQNRGW